MTARRRLSGEEVDETEYLFPEFGVEAIKTIGRCRAFVGSLYRAIENLHGEAAARKLFTPFGGKQMPRDKTLDDDTVLLWRHLNTPNTANRNAQMLARILVDEGRSPTFEAALRHIKLIKDPKTKRGRAALEHLEWVLSFQAESFFGRVDLATGRKK